MTHYHVCFGTEGNLRVSEIGTPESNSRHSASAMPVLAEIGIEAGEPELIEIHNTVKR